MGPKLMRRQKDRPAISSVTEWPPVVYLWGFASAFIGYFIVDSIFHPKSHPIHWLSALGGGLIGIAVGWLWFHRRGDIP